MAERLKGRIALVTGASRGLGYQIAKGFAAEGAHVIALARTTGGLEELDDEIKDLGGSATLVPIDLLKGEDIDRLAMPLLERFGRLDVLVGNAAMLGRLTPLGHYPPDLWEEVFALNVHANWRLIRVCDPLLRRSEAGRVLFVTSGITRRASAYWGAYAASKAALETLATTYAAEMMQTNVKINLVNPGALRTGMRAAAFPNEDPASLATPASVLEPFIRLAAADSTAQGEWISANPK